MADALTPWLRWLPYGLLPSALECGQIQPAIVELRLPHGESDWLAAFQAETIETVQACPVDSVLKEFALRATLWHVAAGEYKARTRKARTTLLELRQWINATESLAMRLPFGGPLKDQMTQAAARMTEDLNWPARYFRVWPTSVETKADAEWRVSLNLWGADRLMRAINEVEPDAADIRKQMTGTVAEPLKIPPTAFWPVMFEWCPRDRADPPFAVYKEAQKRVSRFDQTVKSDMREALMIDLLRDVMQRGHFHQHPATPPK